MRRAPERVLVPDESGKTFVDRFDGETRLGDIVDALLADDDAPRHRLHARGLSKLFL